MPVPDFDESKYKRDDHGKFAPGGAEAFAEAHAREQGAQLSRLAVARSAVAAAVGQGGVTVDSAGKPVTKGFAVAVHRGLEVKVPGAELTANHVESFLKNNAALLSQPGQHFGMWHDAESDHWFMDVSHVVASRGEATALGRKHDQLAVYDLHNKQEIRLTKTRASDRGKS